MTSISAFLSPDHQRCDALFADAEAAAVQGDWEKTGATFSHFNHELRHHFTMEESVMFPAFEDRTGMSGGPTAMMRMEHTQMTELLDQMAEAVASRDSDAFLGDCETLLIIMQQHNMKEEQMLYVMADQVLADDADAIVERMRAVNG